MRIQYPDNIIKAISKLEGGEFEQLVETILHEAGFQNVVRQSSGYQGGFDIRACYEGLEWRFEAKKTKGISLSEKELADKFDQIERNPGSTEYYILVTNTNLSTALRDSIVAHRNNWYIDLDYWSLCNEIFIKMLLSYPFAVTSVLKLTKSEETEFVNISNDFLQKHSTFLKDELGRLRKTSNRFSLLQNAADSISKDQTQKVKPYIEFSKLIQRGPAEKEFERFVQSKEYSCFFLLAKEQMGKTSLLRLWADLKKKQNIVFFFNAREICCGSWLDKLKDKLYSEIEKVLSGARQCPEYISTLFYRMQPRLEAKKVNIYIFVDTLNFSAYDNIVSFFESSDFKKSLRDWKINWIFSCRESTWKEWEEYLDIPKKPRPLNYYLHELNDNELDSMLLSHEIDFSDLPHWIRSKFRHPGIIRLCKKIQSDSPGKLKDMPEMSLAEISLMFLQERFKEFASLQKSLKAISKDGIEEVAKNVIALFKDLGYKTLPFNKINELKDFDCYHLSEASLNIVLQQGFLTKKSEGYELGNDWGVVIAGKYMIDVCRESGKSKVEVDHFLDDVFAWLAPTVTPEGGIRLDDVNHFERILWFALHYGKICDISEHIFRMIWDRILEGQNLSHAYLSENSAKLFPLYSIRYFSSLSSNEHGAIIFREGLEKISAHEVVPEVINLFARASEMIKFQMAILLEHHKNANYIEDIYSLLDKVVLSDTKDDMLHVKDKFTELLNSFPDEICRIIQSRYKNGDILDVSYATWLIGWNGSLKYKTLLQNMVSQLNSHSKDAIGAMGMMRMEKVESLAMDIVKGDFNIDLRCAALDALGSVRSRKLLEWCKLQSDIHKREGFFFIVRSLQQTKLPEAFDFIIDTYLNKKNEINYLNISSLSRARLINKSQFNTIVEGILNNLKKCDDVGKIRRGLEELAAFNMLKHHTWWQEYLNTEVPSNIAVLAKECAKTKYFESRSQTLGSMAMDKALEILDWIGDRDVFVQLLIELMEAKISHLFAWTLFPYVVKYMDEEYKDTLIEIATHPSTNKGDNSTSDYDYASYRACLCLTHLSGSDVADTILQFLPSWWISGDGKYYSLLKHFESKDCINRLVDIVTARDEVMFWGAYRFLWDMLPLEALTPSVDWLMNSNSEDNVQPYLFKLIGKYDNFDVNKKILKYLEKDSTRIKAMQAFLYSKDPQINKWFEKRVEYYSSKSILISGDNDELEHRVLLSWINSHNYSESTLYLQQWIDSSRLTWIKGERCVAVVFKLIHKYKLWDMVNTVKSRYYQFAPQKGSSLWERILQLVFANDPEWAWNEFIIYWNESSDFERKNSINLVEVMASHDSIEWLINVYPSRGKFFHNEKEIRKSIRRIVSEYPKELRRHGIELIKEKSLSGSVKERSEAAMCCSLMGESLHKELAYLIDDHCAKVRHNYQSAPVIESELINANI